MLAQYAISGEAFKWKDCALPSVREDETEFHPYHAGRQGEA